MNSVQLFKSRLAKLQKMFDGFCFARNQQFKQIWLTLGHMNSFVPRYRGICSPDICIQAYGSCTGMVQMFGCTLVPRPWPHTCIPTLCIALSGRSCIRESCIGLYCLSVVLSLWIYLIMPCLLAEGVSPIHILFQLFTQW